MTRLSFLLVCFLTFMLCEVRAAPPPVDSFVDSEEDANMTIDEILARENQFVSGMTSDGVILTELDMLVTPEQYKMLYGEESSEERVKRKAASFKRNWPNAQLVYTTNHEFSSTDLHRLKKAMTDIEYYTCVSFRERTRSDRNYVYMQSGKGCSSYLGMIGGRQVMNLQRPGCRSRGIYIHEILHALAVVHEHQRPDRDDHLNIYPENIQSGALHNFNKYSSRAVSTMNVEYDYASIMHYSTKAFSKNNQHTLYPKDPDNAKFIKHSSRSGLGYGDVKILNLMYKCASHCPDKNKCTVDGHLDQNCNCICKDGSQDCDTTKMPEPDESCKNDHFNSWECYRRAAERHCITRSWDMRGCDRACGRCGKTDDPLQGACKDVYKANRCGRWKERGECDSNPELMKQACRKTCNLCD